MGTDLPCWLTWKTVSNENTPSSDSLEMSRSVISERRLKVSPSIRISCSSLKSFSFEATSGRFRSSLTTKTFAARTKTRGGL